MVLIREGRHLRVGRADDGRFTIAVHQVTVFGEEMDEFPHLTLVLGVPLNRGCELYGVEQDD